MKLNAIQQMLADTGMLAYKLPVKGDTAEHEVIINGVECDYCHGKEHPDLVHYIQDVSVCEACYDHFNERWD
jgi:formylmethanofuran dehydrogenase subunit E